MTISFDCLIARLEQTLQKMCAGSYIQWCVNTNIGTEPLLHEHMRADRHTHTHTSGSHSATCRLLFNFDAT